MSTTPNYRIYDCTGGNVTHDIYATDIADAIDQGREWMLCGEWGDHQGTLDACVREIVRYGIVLVEEGCLRLDGSDIYAIESTDTADGGGWVIEDQSDPEAPQSLDWCDTEAEARGLLKQYSPYGQIDSRATLMSDAHDCSAEIVAEEPECDDGEDHDWRAPHDVVGGVRENPGVFGSGHGSVKVIEYCIKCGKIRSTDYGASDHSGRQCTRVTVSDPEDYAD
jgi:hypothetical protein